MPFFFFFFFDKETALSDFSKGFNSFLERKRLKVPAVAKELCLKRGSVYTWKAGRGFPEFQTLFKLFEMGMTLEEMFGERLAKVIEENSGFSGRVAELEETIESQRKQIENLKIQVGLMEKMDELTTPPPEIANSKEYKKIEKKSFEVFEKMGLAPLAKSLANEYDSILEEMKKMKARLDKIENGNK